MVKSLGKGHAIAELKEFPAVFDFLNHILLWLSWKPLTMDSRPDETLPLLSSTDP